MAAQNSVCVCVCVCASPWCGPHPSLSPPLPPQCGGQPRVGPEQRPGPPGAGQGGADPLRHPAHHVLRLNTTRRQLPFPHFPAPFLSSLLSLTSLLSLSFLPSSLFLALPSFSPLFFLSPLLCLSSVLLQLLSHPLYLTRSLSLSLSSISSLILSVSASIFFSTVALEGRLAAGRLAGIQILYGS